MRNGGILVPGLWDKDQKSGSMMLRIEPTGQGTGRTNVPAERTTNQSARNATAGTQLRNDESRDGIME